MKNLTTIILWLIGGSFFISFLFITTDITQEQKTTTDREKQEFKEGLIKSFKAGLLQWTLKANSIEVGHISDETKKEEPAEITDSVLTPTPSDAVETDLYEKSELYTPEDVQEMVNKTKKHIYGDNTAATKNVEIKMYDIFGTHTNTITGEVGIINFETGDFWLTTNVVIINEEKKLTIKTAELFYSSTHRRFFSTQNVVISDDKNATLHGSMLDTDIVMNEMHLFNTNGVDITKSFLSGLRLNRTRFDLK